MHRGPSVDRWGSVETTQLGAAVPSPTYNLNVFKTSGDEDAKKNKRNIQCLSLCFSLCFIAPTPQF